MTTEANEAGFHFDNSYRRLPDRFFALLDPTPVQAPKLIALNRALADGLGLDADSLSGDFGAQVFSGSAVPTGAEPLAMAYAGHQFGTFVPQLGDGRALLLGEIVDRSDMRRDIQLKGSGRTPFSRGGDGRAAIGPVLREYIVSEAMHRLGIPTTRSLAAATTGEVVLREDRLPGAVLCRVASSHIRVGTFQYFAARGDDEALSILRDYVINRHYPQLREAETPALGLVEAVGRAQAKLVAQWMAVGFIHGVMNTDNFSISGETIDYGPCAFMDVFAEGQVFSSIDYMGRYAYNAQPRIAQWNLARLAETLLPLIDPDPEKAVTRVNPVIGAFADWFEAEWLGCFRRKLGLRSAEDGDAALIRALLAAMQKGEADFTLTFRHLAQAIDPDQEAALRDLFSEGSALDSWIPQWRDRLNREEGSPEERRQAMAGVNPRFIPRNHRIEEAITAAQNDGNFGPFEKLTAVLANPFDDQPDHAAYADPPTRDQVVLQTFCGT